MSELHEEAQALSADDTPVGTEPEGTDTSATPEGTAPEGQLEADPESEIPGAVDETPGEPGEGTCITDANDGESAHAGPSHGDEPEHDPSGQSADEPVDQLAQDQDQIPLALKTRQYLHVRVSSVYFYKGKTQIHFEHRRDQYTLKSESPPHPDFCRAFVALNDDLLNILEMVKNEHTPVRTFQVNITHKGEREGYRLFGMRSLRNTPQAHKIETPMKWSGDKDPRQVLDDDQIARLNRLLGEARLYLCGKRGEETGDMFAEPQRTTGATGGQAALAGGPSGDPTGGPSGDGALPEGELPQVDPAVRLQAAIGGLISLLGLNPNPNSVVKTDEYYKGAIARVSGWLADRVHPAAALTAVSEHLEASFHDWRRAREDEGAVAGGPAFSKSQLKKVDNLAQKLTDLVAAAREAEATALIEPPVDGDEAGQGAAESGASEAPAMPDPYDTEGWLLHFEDAVSALQVDGAFGPEADPADLLERTEGVKRAVAGWQAHNPDYTDAQWKRAEELQQDLQALVTTLSAKLPAEA